MCKNKIGNFNQKIAGKIFILPLLHVDKCNILLVNPPHLSTSFVYAFKRDILRRLILMILGCFKISSFKTLNQLSKLGICFKDLNQSFRLCFYVSLIYDFNTQCNVYFSYYFKNSPMRFYYDRTLRCVSVDLNLKFACTCGMTFINS